LLSLVICTYQRPQPIQHLLQAIAEGDRPPNETLIVDGSEGFETQAVVVEHAQSGDIPNLSYLRVPPEQRGLTRQRNYGIARAREDIIAFLDDDTIPSPDYFTQVLACFERHREAIGVGGYITNEVQWQHKGAQFKAGLSNFQFGNWVRCEDYRWRLRRVLGLVSTLPPGWVPPFSHGRSVGFLPPDGKDYQVEFFFGGASAWRRGVFEQNQFSNYFEGYGLYEDLDFCLRASRHGPLFLSTRACLEHHHASSGRPDYYHYGKMVVRNGWYVWRQRWPDPTWPDRTRWWAITILLTLARVGDSFRSKQGAFSEALGRTKAMFSLIWDKPR